MSKKKKNTQNHTRTWHLKSTCQRSTVDMVSIKIIKPQENKDCIKMSSSSSGQTTSNKYNKYIVKLFFLFFFHYYLCPSWSHLTPNAIPVWLICAVKCSLGLCAVWSGPISQELRTPWLPLDYCWEILGNCMQQIGLVLEWNDQYCSTSHEGKDYWRLKSISDWK